MSKTTNIRRIRILVEDTNQFARLTAADAVTLRAGVAEPAPPAPVLDQTTAGRSRTASFIHPLEAGWDGASRAAARSRKTDC
ncbi:hypothetical protein [Gaopeijia maritima]|uniref:Uncharacterized protein n=1 Tax=Gaopeijia maritima TaxID=3119007 RepID=A0ABU9EAY9_9BACT